MKHGGVLDLMQGVGRMDTSLSREGQLLEGEDTEGSNSRKPATCGRCPIPFRECCSQTYTPRNGGLEGGHFADLSVSLPITFAER